MTPFGSALTLESENAAENVRSRVAHRLLPCVARAPNTLPRSNPSRYSERNFAMFRLSAALLVALLAPTAVLRADARSDAKAQVEFGIDVAQRGLWREAIYRWEKAVEIDPSYAEAHNNLAIAYEHEGQLTQARASYQKAVELAPNNAQIRQNFELFKEINDRSTGDDKP